MKKCPYCAEEIQEEAIKCRYCNEFLDGTMRPAPVVQHEASDTPLPFYLRTSFIVVLFLIAPPFALPSIWLHPKLHLGLKIGLSLLIIGLTWLSYVALQSVMSQLQELTDRMDELSY